MCDPCGPSDAKCLQEMMVAMRVRLFRVLRASMRVARVLGLGMLRMRMLSARM